MKRLFTALVAALILIFLWGCTPEDKPQAGNESAPTQALLTGWQFIEGERYCFSLDGTPLTGWLTDDGDRYYLDQDGRALTGWQEIGGKRFYFSEGGAMVTGWAELEGGSYYFGMDGSLFTGLLNIDGEGYYFGKDGRQHTGWLDLNGKTYYFDDLGIMATGPREIDGETHYFSPHGVKVVLVNPWNFVPKGYKVELTTVVGEYQLETECAQALLQMLADCEAAGYEPIVVSAYRTHDYQEYLFDRKVKSYLELDWPRDKAEKEAAKEVAYPGTSEHQLGLAVDLMDTSYPYLDEKQASTPAQQWLMAHCHEYGFILRYPVGATDITGIIYEPWHYRYVGQEIAQEIMNLGITLEEYLGAA